MKCYHEYSFKGNDPQTISDKIKKNVKSQNYCTCIYDIESIQNKLLNPLDSV